ncbi:transposable element Tcb2 transposase [Trichonephila clavipes]|nr:transposable element Tcb2 transposase [Trichonephila clavipes]
MEQSVLHTVRRNPNTNVRAAGSSRSSVHRVLQQENKPLLPYHLQGVLSQTGMQISKHPAVQCFSQIPLKANHQRLHLKWAHEPTEWETDWHKVVFSDESRFDLWNHVGRLRVRRYAGERCVPKCVIERHSGQTPGVMQDNVRPHVAKTVRDFCSTQHMPPFPWTAYSPEVSPIEHVWDFVGRHLTLDLGPAASNDELLLRIHGILFHKLTFKICLTPCHDV